MFDGSMVRVFAYARTLELPNVRTLFVP